MQSLSGYLEWRLRLKVNASKSAVARPWGRRFLGYSMTGEGTPRLKIAPKSAKRLKDKVRQMIHRGTGRDIGTVIRGVTQLLSGWLQYFRLAAVKRTFELLDEWLRRKLRSIMWRQWKRPWTRARRLMKRGLDRQRAWQSAMNGRGPWWNAGASHMHAVYTKSDFDRMGLISLLDTMLNVSYPTQTAG